MKILRLEGAGSAPMTAGSAKTIIRELSDFWKSNPEVKLISTDSKSKDQQEFSVDARTMLVILCIASDSDIDVSQYRDQIPDETVTQVKSML